MGIQSSVRRVAPEVGGFLTDEDLQRLQQTSPAVAPTQPLAPSSYRNDDRPVAGDAPPSQQSAQPSRSVALPDALPSNVPIDAPDAHTDFPKPTPTLATIGAPPTMIVNNNKGRPVDVIGGGDQVAANEELLRAQQGYKAPRSTKDQILSFLTGGIPGGISYATNQETRNQWASGQAEAKTKAEGIDQPLAIQRDQAQTKALQYRPVWQQNQQDMMQQRIDQGQQRADANDQRVDQGQQRVDQGDRRLDQGDTRLDRNAPVDVNVDGQTFKVPPQVAARIANQQSEGAKGRAARKANVDAIIAATNGRQEKQIQASIAKLGDPQEMYSAASDIWDQATEKEQQANSMAVRTTADVATKKQLLDDAGKLKATTVRIQGEARKARSAGSVQTAAPKKFATLDDAIQGFKNSPKNPSKRDPTPDEVNRLKQTYGVQ